MPVQCDVCGAEVANSEEMKAHKEREHSLDERDAEDQELEKPDHMDSEPMPAPVIPGKSN
jgi:hypothetical protein